ncbi:Oxysterol-binding protein 3 [Hypoxylon texense]
MCDGEIHEWICGCGELLDTDRSIPVGNRCEAYNPITDTCDKNPVLYLPSKTDVRGECDNCKSARLAREAAAEAAAHEEWRAELARVEAEILGNEEAMKAEEEAKKAEEEARRADAAWAANEAQSIEEARRDIETFYRTHGYPPKF